MKQHLIAASTQIAMIEEQLGHLEVVVEGFEQYAKILEAGSEDALDDLVEKIMADTRDVRLRIVFPAGFAGGLLLSGAATDQRRKGEQVYVIRTVQRTASGSPRPGGSRCKARVHSPECIVSAPGRRATRRVSCGPGRVRATEDRRGDGIGGGGVGRWGALFPFSKSSHTNFFANSVYLVNSTHTQSCIDKLNES